VPGNGARPGPDQPRSASRTLLRPTGWATNPATNTVNVSNVGMVKHDRNGSNTRNNVDGRVRPRSIGGTLFRRSCDQHRRCSTQHLLKIHTTRRQHLPSSHDPADYGHPPPTHAESAKVECIRPSGSRSAKQLRGKLADALTEISRTRFRMGSEWKLFNEAYAEPLKRLKVPACRN
jgi:hypothetical protein